MDVEWKEIFVALLEGVDDLNIFTYRLTDGSYIMAEEVDFEDKLDCVFIDLPVSLSKNKKSQFVLESWMFQHEVEIEEGISTEPIVISFDNIIARTEATTNLKESYMRFIFLQKLSNKLDHDEFISLVEEISSFDLDKKDSSSDPLMDMYNKRIQYPYFN